ncbi:MAG: transcriptional activator NhaR [Candidatus Eisenbacteria bacterium]|uniref:Transcriptional activator NhaR n=1 Tax=Eiseniibacteriota bacterium TaxID=2212470 RepID=A0A956M0L6_UNCEI|nr:transcriptional activator NhaR [Candidatus Eisenbacteria bacterium]
MEFLNYHHLLYFWTVAKEGGVTEASKVLHLTHPTISGQIRQLEESLGEKLFVRSGRRLQLTEVGRVVYRYADEIFGLGRELVDTLQGRPTGQPIRLAVGILDVVPKLIVRRLLDPAFRLPEPVRVVCEEDRYERLLAGLALHELDVVFADAPVPSGSSLRVFHHLLGECGLSFFANAELTKERKRGFPRSLDGAPLLLPTRMSATRRGLEQWFEARKVRPNVVAEIEDSSLLSVLGADGLGIFPGPTAIEKEICRQYQVRVVGRASEIQERFYAVSVERKIKDPAVIRILGEARSVLFPAR